MLQRAFAIITLSCLLTLNLSGLLVLAGFELNRGYIANELCVNKNRLEMHCNGRCYLMKKLRQAQDKEQKQAIELQKLQSQYALTVSPFSFRAYSAKLSNYDHPFSTGIPVSREKSVFHPPQKV